MEHTSNRTLTQVCDIMSVFACAQADTDFQSFKAKLLKRTKRKTKGATA